MESKLYYDQPYLREFDTEIIEIQETEKGIFRIKLQETAFYPTSGGQPHDTGTIQDIPVYDVTEENGLVFHYTRTAPTERFVHCVINWERRFDFMQQHGGQHILSEAFWHHCQGKTIGFHLTEENLTIDLDLSTLTKQQILQVEETANDIVWQNRPIRRHWVEPEDLSNLPLRKQPQVQENIRIIEIADFDWVPCGGTHPERTGEIGLIKIRRWERSKGVMRIEFFCGHRALKDYRWKNQMILDLAAQFSVKDTDLCEAIVRQQGLMKEVTKNFHDAENQFLEVVAETLREKSQKMNGLTIIRGILPDTLTLIALKKLALILVKTPNTVALLRNEQLPAQFTFARSAELDLPLNQALRETQKTLGGKGGGSEILVEGSLSDKHSPEKYQQLYLETVIRHAAL